MPEEKPKNSKLKRILLVVMGVFLCLNVVFFYVSHVISTSEIKAPSFEYPELPRLYIELNGTTLEEINSGSKDIRYKNNTATFLVDKEYYDFENVEIKGRGNSTWNDGEKKPYQIKFDSKENLFGLGKAKTWVLLANYFDDALIRNDVAFEIARLLEMKYTNDGEFVELYIDNQYVGLYYLTQKIGINRSSINIKNDGAVLMEMDNIYFDEELKKYKSSNGDIFILKDSVSDIPEQQESAVQEFMKNYSDFERAVEEKDWTKIQELIDVESFAKFYIIQNFTLNWDAFTTSMFFYKDGINDKIHAGPVWDFDNSLGRWLETAFYRRDLEYNTNNFYNEQSDTFFDLIKIKEFRMIISKIVQKNLLPNSNRIMARIDNTSNRINNAALRDNSKWNKNDYYEGVQKLKDTVQKRLDYYAIFYANEETNFDGNYLFKNLNMNFRIIPLDDGGYKVIRASDNKALTLDESYNEYGAVSFHTYKDLIWQKWYICRDNEGKYYLFSFATESVLAIDENGRLITKPLTRAENEQFEIAEIGAFPLDTLIQKN